MNSFTYEANDLAATDRLGAALAELLPDGTTIALLGTLGAGKTRLVQALAAACGIARDHVVSPTFVLCQHYHGSRTLYHMDAYRIRDDDEFLQLGPEEYFESPGLTIIEWADRVADCLPPEYLEIRIEVTGQSSRLFTVRNCGESLTAVVSQLDDSKLNQ